jgi:hypothetical protein
MVIDKATDQPYADFPAAIELRSDNWFPCHNDGYILDFELPLTAASWYDTAKRLLTPQIALEISRCTHGTVPKPRVQAGPRKEHSRAQGLSLAIGYSFALSGTSHAGSSNRSNTLSHS